MAPAPAPGSAGRPDRTRFMLTATPRSVPTPAQDLRRRWLVTIAKRVLPLAALGLLALLTVWPELTTEADRARFSYRQASVTPQGGVLRDASYTGVDESGQRYTLTATSARQMIGGPDGGGRFGADRTMLKDPAGDIALAGGGWLMVQSAQGVYMQRDGQLDLSGEVTLFRDDGIEMQTNAVTIDLKAGAALGAEQVHVQGPFGTLDAQGFAVTDRGATWHFVGPARLRLDGAGR